MGKSWDSLLHTLHLHDSHYEQGLIPELEFNLGSERRPRGTLPIKIRVPNYGILRHFDDLLKDLIQIDVQPRALSTLTQFYDPSIRNFTFQDYQLDPTIEEYEHILGQSLVERQPYLYEGNFSSWAKVAELLKVTKPELMGKRPKRNGEAFIDVLRVDLYVIILLPSLNDYIDRVAMDVFWAFLEKKNPVVVMLANTYYRLNNSREGSRRRLSYCPHALCL
ncbi:hypothetical protein CR513_47123, partial [Mucuna pruriens]